MADKRTSTDGPTPFVARAYDPTHLPDYDNDFVSEDDIAEFAKALAGPDATSPSDYTSKTQSSLYITALNDWRPVYQRVRRKGSKKRPRRTPARGKDETREGFVYALLKWPLLGFVLGWLIFLSVAYLLTRFYIWLYEHFITMRGRRHRLRRQMRSTTSYGKWAEAAQQMDRYLGNDLWKRTDEYAYYNSHTIANVRNELRRLRTTLDGGQLDQKGGAQPKAIAEDLRTLVEASVKNNFVGVENSRLYSETYYGTKDLVQSFVDEVGLSLDTLSHTEFLSSEDKAQLFQHLHTNYGRTALCLSGGATFAYYHFGVVKALLDGGVLPQVITGTSGGALVAALLATRTEDELRQLLIPALASRIRACEDPINVWLPRWWRTGARFDLTEWARRCSWFTRGSLTFREAYQRTGRILNVTCIPSDPHSPTVLANYLTAPDCVIWSAVLASAAVPGILNPVVLMRKTRRGTLAPYSFGHKWKDGSLRTDVPLKALNAHFNVTFSIVSQVNPHINLFFFSSRGTVGRPVTHRRGRGWRGGFLGSAIEQYLKLDLTKWLKVLKHLELLPRAAGQDWSDLWLQRFSGTITIWPRTKLSDFFYILSDPDMKRLARMIHAGQQSTFPKLLFIANRMKIERKIEDGRALEDPVNGKHVDNIASGSEAEDEIDARARELATVLSDEDLSGLLRQTRKSNQGIARRSAPAADDVASNGEHQSLQHPPPAPPMLRTGSPSLAKTLSGYWWGGHREEEGASSPGTANAVTAPTSPSWRWGSAAARDASQNRRSSLIAETWRQSQVFFDDPYETDENVGAEGGGSETDEDHGFGGKELEVDGVGHDGLGISTSAD